MRAFFFLYWSFLSFYSDKGIENAFPKAKRRCWKLQFQVWNDM